MKISMIKLKQRWILYCTKNIRLTFKSVIEILTAIKNKDVSASELTNDYLNRIKDNDDDLNCFITVTEESTMRKAKRLMMKFRKEFSNLYLDYP